MLPSLSPLASIRAHDDLLGQQDGAERQRETTRAASILTRTHAQQEPTLSQGLLTRGKEQKGETEEGGKS